MQRIECSRSIVSKAWAICDQLSLQLVTSIDITGDLVDVYPSSVLQPFVEKESARDAVMELEM